VELQKLPRNQSAERYSAMVQSLLADRFKLRSSREKKDFPVYELAIAKNGPKLHESKPGDAYPNGIKDFEGRGHGKLLRIEPIEGGQLRLIGQGIPIVGPVGSGPPGSLMGVLTDVLGRTVMDQTGLKGIYDFTLQWAPDQSQAATLTGPEGTKPATDNQSQPESSGPSIFTALQEQLGLKLESTKAPVDVLVIDHIERPSEN